MNKYEYVRQRPQSSVVFRRKLKEFPCLEIPLNSNISSLAVVENSRRPEVK